MTCNAISVQLKTLFVLSLIAQSTWSGEMGVVCPTQISPMHALFTVTLGPDFVKEGRVESRTVLPPFQTYSATLNEWKTVLDVGAFYGMEYVFNNRFQAQLGVSGYADTDISAKGAVLQFGTPLLNNLTFNYKIRTSRVMLAGKFLTSLISPVIHPYFSWEVGAAFNRTNGFIVSSVNPSITTSVPFENHTQTSFAYGVGLGVDYALSQRVRLGVGYQFADLGRTSLGEVYEAVARQTLNVPHLYANQLRFQFSYII